MGTMDKTGALKYTRGFQKVSLFSYTPLLKLKSWGRALRPRIYNAGYLCGWVCCAASLNYVRARAETDGISSAGVATGTAGGGVDLG